MLGNANGLDIQMLEAVAKARFGLRYCARWLRQLASNNKGRLTSGESRPCDVAKQLCSHVGIKWPRYVEVLDNIP